MRNDLAGGKRNAGRKGSQEQIDSGMKCYIVVTEVIEHAQRSSSSNIPHGQCMTVMAACPSELGTFTVPV